MVNIYMWGGTVVQNGAIPSSLIEITLVLFVLQNTIIILKTLNFFIS